ncbi:MAG TPA: hypothetical protein VF781_07005 [Solirubrobacteraceae bacterium]
MRNDSRTQSDRAPRVRRTAAAVIAQYIQDLTRPAEPAPCAPAA